MQDRSTGSFVISLDFELHWGGFEKWPLDISRVDKSVGYERYFLNTRAVIPQMLELFAANGIQVTWATVGMLFHENQVFLREDFPAAYPEYKEKKLSAYNYIEKVGIGRSEQEDPFHFARSLVLQIHKTPGQEVGTHTFAHYYCNEAGQTPEQFAADLDAAIKSAARLGIEFRSLVFPRNQFNQDYLKVCADKGITSVRSNPKDWFWKIDSTQDESRWKRFNRGLDAFLPIGKKSTYQANSIVRHLPLLQPASRLLRPWSPKESRLSRLKMTRIKTEMNRAAMHGEVYHLWWHPHNFGYHPTENMEELGEIVGHFKVLQKAYGFESLSMGALSNRLLKQST